MTPDKLIEAEGGKIVAADGNRKTRESHDPKAMRLKLLDAYKSNLADKVSSEVATTTAPAKGTADKGMQLINLFMIFLRCRYSNAF